MLEQLLPHSLEAEEAVLGSLLVDGEAYCKWRGSWLVIFIGRRMLMYLER